MRITLFIGSLSGGGAERVVCNLANYLSKKGHEVTVLTVSDQKTYELSQSVKHTVLYGETGSKLPHIIINLLRLLRMNRYFKKAPVDLYITFLPELNNLILSQKKSIKCPIILAERADPNTYCSASRKNRVLFSKYYKRADGYVFQTEDAKEYYENHNIDVTNSRVISNAINPEFVCEPYKGERRKVIVGAGRLTAQKNFPLLINAFYAISNKYPDYTLEIYGDGELKTQLCELVNDLGLNEKVKFLGYVSNIKEYLQSASLFVLSSNFEGMPNALMEAMALGVPVISTDCPAGGSKNLIKDGENGFLVPVGDVEHLSKSIDLILSDNDLRYKIGTAGRKVADRLSADKIYGMWEEFILSYKK